MKIFYNLLVNTLVVSIKNNFVWFALTYWIYLQTQSVVSTGLFGGISMVASASSNFWFGSIVDNQKKKTAMLFSGIATFVMFALGFLLYNSTSPEVFTSVSSPALWLLVVLLLGGVIFGNIYSIAVPTLVTVMVPEKKRDRANGMVGTIMGISFSITSVASGLVLGYGGMDIVLLLSIILTILAIGHLLTIKIPEKSVLQVVKEGPKNVDIKGTIKVIGSIPGLFALILFTTFNNFLGGVFMALMDAYGLTLVSVQAWGLLWGVLSLGFIFGGLFIAKFGLGKSPLITLFRINIVMWLVSIFFTIQPSIILLAIGIFIWICLIPFVEATEQTIIQKVVPQERQGRVFGFAHSIEQAASPLTAFLIGPIAQYLFIPFMTTGAGVDLIGGWFGTGIGRGIALMFIFAGFLGLTVTLIAMRSNQYKLLAKAYKK